MYYIYKIINKLNGKCYVGQHKVPKRKESFYRYMGNGIIIKQALKTYGKENFEKVILEYIEDDEKHEKVSQREIWWIAELKTIYPNGYNISPGGEGGITTEIALRGAATRKAKGYKQSLETKQKISKANKGKCKSDLHKKHLSDNHHLKTIHTIIFEDGHCEDTTESLATISKRFGISSSAKLLRYSARKEFLNGICLLGISKDKYACMKSYKSKKFDLLCKDPIKGDICKFRTLYGRKNRGKNKEQYKNIILDECIIKEIKNEI